MELVKIVLIFQAQKSRQMELGKENQVRIECCTLTRKIAVVKSGKNRLPWYLCRRPQWTGQAPARGWL